MDSVQYIYEKLSFSGFHLQDPSWKDLGSVLERGGVSSEPFWETFWGSFGESDWGAGQQNSVFCWPRLVLAGFLALGWSLGLIFDAFLGRAGVLFECSLLVRGSIPRVF